MRRVEEFHIYRYARSFGRIFIRSRGSNEGVEKRKTVNGKKDETVERGIELIMPRIRKKIYRVWIFHGACGSPTYVPVSDVGGS